MSIEGDWGSGKSSFMQQVQKRLDELRKIAEAESAAPPGRKKKSRRGHVSFRFNAWRHDKQDAMWAAFALCLTTEIRNKQSFLRRLRGDLYLALSRLNTLEGWLHVSSVFVLWTVLLLTSASIIVYLFTRSANELQNFTNQVVPVLAEKAGWIKTTTTKPAEFPQAITLLAEKHVWLAALLVLALGWRWAAKQLGTRLDWKLKKYLNKPDYESHSAFIESFHQDFVNIVKAYAGNDKVFVFIDDLDRCDIPRAAELMQAINLMIGDDPHLVFVIGMDREKVAAGIAFKYKDIAPFLRSTVSDIDAPSARHPAAFGYSYLEKFIQVTFRVPRPSEIGIDEFLRSLSSSEPRAAQIVEVNRVDQSTREERRQLVEVHARADSDEVADLVKIVAPVVDWNPRRIKQFINGFRLHAYVASDLGLLDIVNSKTGAQEGVRLTLEQLGKFIAITISWPDLIMDLVSYPEILGGIYRSRIKSTGPTGQPAATPEAENREAVDSIEASLIARWASERLLVELLQSNISRWDGWRYSLEHANLRLLLNISRRENRSRVTSPAAPPKPPPAANPTA